MKRKLGEFDENESLALQAWLYEAKFRQMLKRQRLQERTILQKLNDREDDLHLFRSSSSNDDDDSSSNDERDDFSSSSKVVDANTKIFFHGKNKDENFSSAEVAMYLAIEMEEDEEQVKYDILPWALGSDWRTSLAEFIAEKDELWKKMNFSSMVSWECIQKVMNMNPENAIWQRLRPAYHSGAVRSDLSKMNDCCSQTDDSKTRLYLPPDPKQTPALCKQCLNALSVDLVPTLLLRHHRVQREP